jgi:hypothetical protein
MKRTELVAAQEIIVGRMWRRWSNWEPLVYNSLTVLFQHMYNC